MLGAIAGDIIGSVYEFKQLVYSEENTKDLFLDQSFFTDDTILTVATADSLLNCSEYASEYFKWASRYKDRGFGGNFSKQLSKGRLEPYNSYGNGSAMRISPVGWFHPTFIDTLGEAKMSAECTHNHPEGIRGAQAVAIAIWAARNNYTKNDIKSFIEDMEYDLSKKISDFNKRFDVTCQGTIPRCMAIFLETNSFESAMKECIMMEGDVDTNCAIVGSIIEAHQGLPDYVAEEVYLRITSRMAKVVTSFTQKYIDEEFKEPDVDIGSKVFEINRK